MLPRTFPTVFFLLLCCFFRHRFRMQKNCFDQLSAYFDRRIQIGRRILKHHRSRGFPSPDPKLFIRYVGILRKNVENCAHHGTFPGPGFPDHSDDLAASHVKADVAHRFFFLTAMLKFHMQMPDEKQFFFHLLFHPPFCSRPTPIKCSEINKRLRTRIGYNICEG